jgi:hypothetical protein
VKAWWQNERSLLAASVRATRRRLRSGYRGSLARGLEAIALRTQAELKRGEDRVRASEARLDSLFERGRRIIVEKDAGTLGYVDLLVKLRLSDELAGLDDPALKKELARSLSGAVYEAVMKRLAAGRPAVEEV